MAAWLMDFGTALLVTVPLTLLYLAAMWWIVIPVLFGCVSLILGRGWWYGAFFFGGWRQLALRWRGSDAASHR